MLFAHDTTAALPPGGRSDQHSASGAPDALTDVAALEIFLDEHHLKHQGCRRPAPATRTDLDAVLNLRERLRGAWEAADAGAGAGNRGK